MGTELVWVAKEATRSGNGRDRNQNQPENPSLGVDVPNMLGCHVQYDDYKGQIIWTRALLIVVSRPVRLCCVKYTLRRQIGVSCFVSVKVNIHLTHPVLIGWPWLCKVLLHNFHVNFFEVNFSRKWTQN